jgi:FkbM family methyltransferase
MKRIVYKLYLFSRKSIWKLIGFRRLMLFGYELRVDSASNFLLSWKDVLLKPHWKKKIVTHVDNIQLYSLAETVSKCKMGSTIVEIGAHHGLYVILLGTILKEKQGKLIAIEPIPSNAEVLRKNVILNKLEDIVIIEQLAIGDVNGQVNMSEKDTESTICMNSSGQLIVPISRLDQVLMKNNIASVDVMIIDVEGAELQVLKSFPWETMRAPYIMCEMHPYNWKEFGYTGADMMSFLQEHHLTCIDMYFQIYTVLPDTGYIGPCFLLPS